jgi:nitrogen fixation protein FixH
MKPSSLHLSADPSGRSGALAADERRGRLYALAFIGAFLLIIAVNATLIVLATDTFSGLQTEGAYQKGLAYNATLAAARAQERLGWRADIEVSPHGAIDARHRQFDISLLLHDAAGEPIVGHDVTVYFSRPTREGDDFAAALAPSCVGRYSTAVDVPLPGQWDLTIVAQETAIKGAKSTWQTTQRIYLP